jgi:spermidine synthase
MVHSGRWYYEVITPYLLTAISLEDVVYSGKSRYQQVQILRLSGYGLTLVLDGKTQSSEADEHIYHEALVHPTLFSCNSPLKRVFIGGGGEGATLREVLRHRSVEQAVMVDIDGEVLDVCRRFLPNHHQGAFDDPRTKLIIGDARGNLADAREPFDTIVLDLADPIEGGPAYKLYTREFYQMAYSKLNPGGVLTTQSGAASPLLCDEALTPIAHTIAQVFPETRIYTVFIPAFNGPWSFVMGIKEPVSRPLAPAHVDRLVTQRLSQPTRFYDGLSHEGMFALPRYLRDGLANETRVVTDDNPVFVV